MGAKKDLARKIVTDFHSADAAAKAAEDWAKQFQKGETPDDVEEVAVRSAEIGSSIDESGRTLVRLDRLLVKCGLAESATDATRKLKQGSVRIQDQVATDPRMILLPGAGPPWRIELRVGKRLKIAVIEQ
jgi:tyrosyl-tRNA synthetase